MLPWQLDTHNARGHNNVIVTGHTSNGPATLQQNRDRSRSVSIRDVARAAGVSYQTVSRVINESPSVRGSTREAVLDAIARLGFRPNRAARALAGGRCSR